jgi:membrane protein implicated in regulation of membrane protease activity
MTTFLKADIFFFIASVAMVVFSILSAVLFYYLIKIVKNLRLISDQLKKMTGEVEGSAVFRFLTGQSRKRRSDVTKEDEK